MSTSIACAPPPAREEPSRPACAPATGPHCLPHLNSALSHALISTSYINIHRKNHVPSPSHWSPRSPRYTWTFQEKVHKGVEAELEGEEAEGQHTTVEVLVWRKERHGAVYSVRRRPERMHAPHGSNPSLCGGGADVCFERGGGFKDEDYVWAWTVRWNKEEGKWQGIAPAGDEHGKPASRGKTQLTRSPPMPAEEAPDTGKMGKHRHRGIKQGGARCEKRMGTGGVDMKAALLPRSQGTCRGMGQTCKGYEETWPALSAAAEARNLFWL
ncbi:hypothetical protein FB451DRAFT_1166944 [Mycena latifolia]|nr:hypothetical protein FB451DRAFT_1166944 [Mycena latifolia]